MSLSTAPSALLQLTPKTLWQVFDLLTQCPRPSKHEETVLVALEQLCDEHSLNHIRDSVGNLIISKPASPGFENRQGVVMQGHIDMVPQKNADSRHNFETDPITTLIEDGWVTADGTTLGADNGIGVAAALAVLISKDIQHGPLELLITIDEESGMTGASGLQADSLNGDILLNLDTEDEGEIYVGCAGGVDVSAEINMAWQPLDNPNHKSAFEIAVKGLRGGHSGLDIDQGRANANKIINRFLMQYQAALNLSVFSFDGGTLRNAIARESFTQVVIETNKQSQLEAAISDFISEIQQEYASVEPNFIMESRPIELPKHVYTQHSLDAVMHSVAACTHGVTRMSHEFEGVVETSNNLAIVKSEADQVTILSLVRSLSDHARDDLARSIEATFLLAKARTEISGTYPGWKPDASSSMLSIMSQVYENEFSTPARIKVIHAGLECGLFSAPYPHWDMISIGPTIRHAHSPDEKVHIESVQKFWDFLLASLKAIPIKAD